MVESPLVEIQQEYCLELATVLAADQCRVILIPRQDMDSLAAVASLPISLYDLLYFACSHKRHLRDRFMTCDEIARVFAKRVGDAHPTLTIRPIETSAIIVLGESRASEKRCRDGRF